ncbi:MAG: hypothetical protein IT470_06035 [Pseudomonadales bacterium]|nr:hypothetical protein [Pseudomonadales bacterium]
MIAVHTVRQLPVSAASGLVILGNTVYVVADDALHLGIYKLDDPHFAQYLRLREGDLPADKKARKNLKPDFEALAWLPPTPQYSHGALLAVGSGSKANRQRAVLVPLDAQGHVTSIIHTLDFAPLYAALQLDDCNIEGAVACGERLVLLQRGNNRHEKSALVILSGVDIRTRFSASQTEIIPVALPTINGVPLGFTDGVFLPNGNLLFSAVAEDTDDSYNDGVCLGAAIGEMTLQGEVLRCEMLAEPHKIEGLALSDDGAQLYAVTDAADPNVMASLLRVEA